MKLSYRPQYQIRPIRFKSTRPIISVTKSVLQRLPLNRNTMQNMAVKAVPIDIINSMKKPL